jgi:putative membrane protein
MFGILMSIAMVLFTFSTFFISIAKQVRTFGGLLFLGNAFLFRFFSGLALVFIALLAYFPVRFVATMEPWHMAVVSIVSMISAALVVYWLFCSSVGWRKGLGTIAVLSVYAQCIESLSLVTGFPYGFFSYGSVLGPKFLGLAPYTVSLGWVPLVIAFFMLVRTKTNHPLQLVALTTVLLTAFDLVLDPAAVVMGFWSWPQGGWWYGIPLSNYAGWMLSGVVGSLVLSGTMKEEKQSSWFALEAFALVLRSSLAFWIGVCFFAGLVGPVLVGVVLLGMSFFLPLARHADEGFV